MFKLARDPFNEFRFVLFFFCIQFPGSLPRLKFADQNIINASKMKQLYTNRTGDKTYVWRKFACFHNSIDLLLTWFHVRMKEYKPMVFGAFSWRENAFRSCARWNKTHVRPFFKGSSNFYFVGKSIYFQPFRTANMKYVSDLRRSRQSGFVCNWMQCN